MRRFCFGTIIVLVCLSTACGAFRTFAYRRVRAENGEPVVAAASPFQQVLLYGRPLEIVRSFVDAGFTFQFRRDYIWAFYRPVEGYDPFLHTLINSVDYYWTARGNGWACWSSGSEFCRVLSTWVRIAGIDEVGTSQDPVLLGSVYSAESLPEAVAAFDRMLRRLFGPQLRQDDNDSRRWVEGPTIPTNRWGNDTEMSLWLSGDEEGMEHWSTDAVEVPARVVISFDAQARWERRSRDEIENRAQEIHRALTCELGSHQEIVRTDDRDYIEGRAAWFLGDRIVELVWEWGDYTEMGFVVLYLTRANSAWTQHEFIMREAPSYQATGDYRDEVIESPTGIINCGLAE